MQFVSEKFKDNLFLPNQTYGKCFRIAHFPTLFSKFFR